MIVVIGAPVFRPAEPGVVEGVSGLAWHVALAAVEAGASVQFVAKVGDDAAGDALVLALGRAGIGHAAVLRDAGHPTPILAAAAPAEDAIGDAIETGDSLTDALLAPESGTDEVAAREPLTSAVFPSEPTERPRLDAADVDLALRYLTDYAVVVVADELDPASAEVVSAGAAYANAQLVAVVPPGGTASSALAGGTVLEAPPSDPDDAFARLVAGYAKALDDGRSPAEAFRAVVEGAGWELARA